jgi:delta8-fatty-acid desaturase
MMVFYFNIAGHAGITHSRIFDTFFGMFLANFVGGLSIAWWKHSHYVHHIITNDPEHDPDIQHVPFFAVSTRFTENLYSTFHERELTVDTSFFVTRQHYFYYVILAFGRFNLYVQSWKHVITNSFVPFRNYEVLGQIGYWMWFLYLLSQLPTWGHVFLFFLVSHVVTALLHVQITLSHFGMSTEVIDDETFAEKALRTSMDVDCPRWLDWLHGGLQFQVEHHLFPRVPRHNLRQVQPYVKAFAKKHGLNFYSYTFLAGNGFVLGRLKEVSDQISVILNPTIDHIKTE